MFLKSAREQSVISAARKVSFCSQRPTDSLNLPVKCDGAEAEHSDRAEEFMEELDGLAEHQSVEPPAAAGARSERDVEGNAHQAGADTRARQVLDEAAGHRFKDVSAAGAPQHRGIACGEEERFKAGPFFGLSRFTAGPPQYTLPLCAAKMIALS